GLDASEQRRRIKQTFLWRGPARLPTGRAFRDTLCYELFDSLQLDRGNDRANVDPFVERIAYAKIFHPAPEFLDDFCSDPFLHKEAAARAADLTLVEPDRVDDPFDCSIKIRVFKNDKRGLATQFQREF